MNKNNRIYRTLAAAKHAFFDEPNAEATKNTPPPADKKADNSKDAVKKDNAPLPTVTAEPITIEGLKAENCTGCGACYAVCPKNAIEMKTDGEGFWSPVIDHSKCISCKMCAKTCPAMNERTDSNIKSPDCFAVKAEDDIRLKSSSGGVFSLLSDHVFSQGGVVCGAAFTDDFHVEHIIIDKPDQMYKLRGSKYVQSNDYGVFRELKNILDEGRLVLFSGCPCQVAGLRAFLKKDYENLITMDIVCHGIPSPAAFEKYLEETCDISQIKEFRFRTKTAGYNCVNLEIVGKDDSCQLRCIETDPYEKCFHGSIMLRKSCYHCKFCELPRRGDITAGDFWGISQFNKDINDGKGVSLMLINSEKGKTLLENIKTGAQSVQPVPLEYALRNNRFGAKIGLNVNKRRNFFELLSKHSFLKAAEYSTKDKYDVAIMGVWYGFNYGSVATYYALHELISSFGLSVIMIDKILNNSNDPEQSKSHVRLFAEEHFKITRKYKPNELALLNSRVDTFVIGSDQVWNRGISRNFGMAFYFDFVNNDKKKIAYASSFGHASDFSSKKDVTVISKYMSDFDYISVRESDGVKICKDVYGVEATQVLDPVFAADKDIFVKLTEKSIANERPDKAEKYICTYILDPTPEKKDALKWVSEKLGLKLINILDGLPWTTAENTEKMAGMGEIPKDVHVEDWLYYIKNCEFLVTDSCHGMSFGIIFERPFIGIANKRRGVSRFESLLQLFDLTDRYVTDPQQIIGNESLLKPIDYDKVNKILSAEKERSIAWLKNALFAPKKFSSYCAYGAYDERLEEKINE